MVVVDFLFCSFPVCWCVVGAGRGNDRRDLSRAVFPIPASFAQVAEFPFSDFAIKFALCLFFAMISKVLESTLHKFLYSNTFSGLEVMVFFSSQFPCCKNDIRIKCSLVINIGFDMKLKSEKNLLVPISTGKD